MTMTERELLDEKLRETRGAIKDLERLLKLTKEAKKELSEAVDKAVGDLILQAVNTEMEDMRVVIREAQEEAVAKVMDSFDKLAKTLMYGNGQGRGVSLAELANQTRMRRGAS